MSEPATRRTTYKDLFGLPEHLVGEILNGELHTHPRPTPRQARAYSALGYAVGGPFDGGIGGPGGWWILDEPELHFREDVIVPDLAGWRRERMPELPETAWLELAPDWACEILSPATARIDRTLKMSIYARERVPFLWLVDPDARMLEVYRCTTSATGRCCRPSRKTTACASRRSMPWSFHSPHSGPDRVGDGKR